MKRVLAFVSMGLLSAGTFYAQEPVKKPAEVLLGAAADAKPCTYRALKIALDGAGEPMGEWAKPEEKESVLEKLARKDKDYLRAIESLKGSVTLDRAAGDIRRIDASLPESLYYPNILFPVVGLSKLHIILEQRLDGGMWLPTFLQVVVKYWKGFAGFGPGVYNKYQIDGFECGAP